MFKKSCGMNTTTSLKNAVWIDLGQSDYAAMFHVQQILHEKRKQGSIPDTVLLLEHTPCITIGSGGGFEHLLADNSVLKKNGITVHRTTRGGDITYHGPGQLVCYPILALEGAERDLHAYARKMEEVMIRTVHAFGITAGRKAKYPGVWVGNAKIGAMGIAVRHWVTMHGIALNVCTNLHHFSFIVPCGITTNGVTSMTKVLGYPVDLSAVRREMRKQFSEVFQCSLTDGNLTQLIGEEELETT